MIEKEELISMLEGMEYKNLRRKIGEIHYFDLASLFAHFNDNELSQLFLVCSDLIKPEMLIWCEIEVINALIKSIGLIKFSDLVNKLDIDDAIIFVNDLDHSIRSNLLRLLNRDLQYHLSSRNEYRDRCIGRVMEKIGIAILSLWSVEYTISYIKSFSKKNISSCIVIDKDTNPIGYISIIDLMLCENSFEVIENIITVRFTGVNVNCSINEAVVMAKKYNATIIPVINNNNKLVGSLSINRILEIMDSEFEDDILVITGVTRFIESNRVFPCITARFPWLFMQLITAFTVSNIISYFDDVVSKASIAVSVMPIVASMGGNAAAQSMTVTIRSISKDRINNSNMLIGILKEILICTISGFALAIIGGVVVLAIIGNFKLSLIFTSSVMMNFIVGGFIGSFIPILMNYMNFDPAASSSVFVTACTDSFGFFIFLGLSYVFLLN